MSLSALCASYPFSSDESDDLADEEKKESHSQQSKKSKNNEEKSKNLKNNEERPKNSLNRTTEKPNSGERPNFSEEGEINSTTKAAAAANFFDLVAHEGSTISSSDDDDRNSDNSNNDFGQNEAERRPKLPSAMSVLSSSSVSSSVFRNFYREAEDAEFECLERHVKMTEQKRHVTDQLRQRPQRKSRAVCVQFKKGRCRYDADQCRFSHVIGQTLKARLTAAPGQEEGGAPAQQEDEPHPVSMYEATAVRYNAREEEIDDQRQRPRKKRVGVSDTLQPPKKAMQLFDQERQAEVPWLYEEEADK